MAKPSGNVLSSKPSFETEDKNLLSCLFEGVTDAEIPQPLFSIEKGFEIQEQLNTVLDAKQELHLGFVFTAQE